jgi:plastocyanin
MLRRASPGRSRSSFALWVVLVSMLPMSMGVLFAPAAMAASVSIADFAYHPPRVVIGRGESVIWTNSGTHAHTATQDGPLALWDTGRIAPGSFGEVDQGVVLAAGSYPYHCTIHPSMRGVVKVPLGIAPSAGSTGTKFTLTLSGGVQTGYAYDVEERVGAGVWSSYKNEVDTTTISFETKTAGTYYFRSRLHRISDGATSGWSPSRSVSVT